MKKLVISLVIICLIGYMIPIKVLAEEYPAELVDTINQNFKKVHEAGGYLSMSLITQILGGFAIYGGVNFSLSSEEEKRKSGEILLYIGAGLEITSLILHFVTAKSLSDVKPIK